MTDKFQGWVWFNSCPAGGDDGGLTPRDPELPLYGAIPQCPAKVCYGPHDQFGNTWGCGMDPNADDYSDEDACVEAEGRDLDHDLTYNATLDLLPRVLEKRGNERTFEFNFTALQQQWNMRIRTRPYPGCTHLHDSTRSEPAIDYVFQ